MHFLTHNSEQSRNNFPTNFHLKPEGFEHVYSSQRNNKQRSPRASPLVRNRCQELKEVVPLTDSCETLKDTAASSDCRLNDLDCDPPVQETHDCKQEQCQRIVINVAGMKYESQLKTLNRLPDTLLGNPEKRAKYWDPRRKELFFDRHRPTFAAILYYYQSGGRLKRPFEVPLDIFLEELQFYELGGSTIDSFKQGEGFLADEEPEVVPQNKVMRFFYNLFERPESSIAAKIVAILSIIFILTSIVTFCIETLPAFQGHDCVNETVVTTSSDGNITVSYKLVPIFNDPLFIIESCCIAWFAIEIVIRFLSFPSKCKFLKDIINWIDVIAIMPYFLMLGLTSSTMECHTGNNSAGLAVLRVLRVVRIFKLSKHSEGLKILGKTLTTSLRELTMFSLFLGIGMILFSAAIFFAEQSQPDTHFHSIPGAFWWAIVSMTTVGYGDNYPVGVLGKIIGSFCVLSGVLAIALPVPVIVANFNNYYSASKGRGGYSYVID